MGKKISLLILATLLTCTMNVIPSSANSSDYDTSLSTIEQLGNGYYFETIIENSFGPSGASQSYSKSVTIKCSATGVVS